MQKDTDLATKIYFDSLWLLYLAVKVDLENWFKYTKQFAHDKAKVQMVNICETTKIIAYLPTFIKKNPVDIGRNLK